MYGKKAMVLDIHLSSAFVADHIHGSFSPRKPFFVPSMLKPGPHPIRCSRGEKEGQPRKTLCKDHDSPEYTASQIPSNHTLISRTQSCS